ncbi:hypothetical protein V1291_001888 [Nitrobacteraceae bacterium AZCC 1564]
MINARTRFGKTDFLEKAANADPPEISHLKRHQVHQRPQTRWQAKHGYRDNTFNCREGQPSEQGMDWENPAYHRSYETMTKS